MMRLLLLLPCLACAAVAQAQTPEDALAAQWTALCAGASSGSDLAERCTEIFAGGPGSRSAAAVGSFLDEIPGQGRSSTRDQEPGVASARESIAANVSLFASVDLGRLDRSDSPNEAAFSGDTQAVTAGIEWTPTPAWLLAAAFHYSEEELDYDASGGSARGRYAGFLGTVAWNVLPNLSLNGYGGQLDGNNELRRAIDYALLSGTRVTALASASPDSTRTLAGAGLDWTLPRAAWQWRVGLGVDWMRTELEAYTESGGEGLALSVPRREIVTRRGRVDIGLTRTISADWGVWQPLATVGWRHELANASRTLSVRFADDAGATPIRFNTEDADNNWGELAVGSVFTFKHGHSAFVQYRQRFAHEFLQDRVLALGWHLELR